MQCGRVRQRWQRGRTEKPANGTARLAQPREVGSITNTDNLKESERTGFQEMQQRVLLNWEQAAGDRKDIAREKQ